MGTGATSCCRGHSPGPPPQRRTAQCRKTLLQLDSTPNPGAELLPGATTWALGVTPSPAWGRGFGGSGPNLLLPSAGSWLLLQVPATNAQGTLQSAFKGGCCGMGAGTSLDLLCLEGEKTHQKNDERAHNQQTTETKQSHGLKIQAISPCPPPILTLYSVVPRDSRVASKQLTRRAQRHWEKGTSYAKAFRINSAAALKALRNRAPPLHHS